LGTSSRVREVIKKIVFGETLVPQEFTLGIPDPQTEISVWLDCAGVLTDVTERHSIACAAPMVVCVGFNSEQLPDENDLSRVKLRLRRKDGKKQILGELVLKQKSVMSKDNTHFVLFEPHSSSNFCLSKMRLCTHYLLHAYRQRGHDNTNGIVMTFIEKRATMVMFIRPHPIVLGSYGSKDSGNIFPMNLFGNLGEGYLGFALRADRIAGELVEDAGRIAISTMPLSQGSMAYRLAKNHTTPLIDWNQLPFPIKSSPEFSIPIPDFAVRVRELKIEAISKIGSHRFFLAKVIRDETLSEAPAFCSIHGFYQSWRLKQIHERRKELEASLAADALSKLGRSQSATIKDTQQ
jgi:flavin reductase (DIM6/NTAB) family NADH-FMN oxidoreductase RutF